MTKMQKNIMTVDLEDYFCDLAFERWGSFESRICKTTKPILELFRKYNVKATFFTLGYIAEKFPGLIEEIKKDGHEIASHSYSHLDIRQSTKEQFEDDLVNSINILEKISGEKVKGFRAPFFSINKNTIWAIEIIRKYLKYDSSIFPVRTPMYGIPDAPKNIYKPSKSNPLENDNAGEFFEIPPATRHLPIIGTIPIAGGFHLRFLPYFFISSGIKKLNKSGIPAVCYIHPKDLDPGFPKISEYKWYFYYGLNGAFKKFEKLLKDFKFTSIRENIKI